MVRRAFIVTEDAEYGKRRVPVVSSILIGRSVDCDVTISDAAASRHHVEIRKEGDSFYWKDLGSTNGTILNGAQMFEGVLQDGDRFQIGETLLVFEVEEVLTGEGTDSTLFQTLINGEGRPIERTPEDLRTEKLLRAVYAVTNQIATNFEVCTLVDQILETSMQAIDAQRGTILFAGSDQEELLPCPTCGKFHLIQEGRLRHIDREGVQISRTVAHRVLSRGESVLYQDAQSADELSAAASILALNLRSIICVPLRGKYGILGLLYVDTDRPDRVYTREDMLLTTAVGNSAGLALENARMHQETLEKERMEQEIQHAWAIQEGFLVKEWPEDDPRFNIYGETRPAKTVGGDFFDFTRPDPGCVGILIGDVSGKGVPAALTMAQLLAEFRLRARTTRSPSGIIAELNQRLYAHSRFGMFCTLCYITLDLDTGLGRCANAGHLTPLRVSPSAVLEFAGPSGPPIGVLSESPWNDEEFTLAPGETILLYTDGVIEARGMHTRRDTVQTSDEFGLRNLSRVAQGFSRESPKAMVQGINLSVREYTSPASPHDDCTLIALRYEK